jgi:uncharacterized iron-regulated membrane protein
VIRTALTRLHRWVGLGIAIFLALASLSGSLIVFYRELDAALNPELYQVPVAETHLSATALAAAVERQLPGAEVSGLMLSPPPGRSAELWVAAKSGALAYNQVFADPASGKVLGLRQWGKAGLSRAALMPMIYLFHYTLKLPGVWGTLLMGVIGCLWTIDCFVAFALTLPRATPFWRKWAISWRLKRGARAYRRNLDWHRAGGLWVWGMLLVLASSGVALNLPEHVFRPLLKLVTPLSPGVTEIGAPRLNLPPAPASLSFDDAVARGRQAAAVVRFVPRYVFHFPAYHAYGVGFGEAGSDGMDGWGRSDVYLDDRSGAPLLRQMAGQGRAADIYAGAQFQLHSGRILGWPGRILVCLTGLAVAMLSVTGIWIWWKKRAAKSKRAAYAFPHVRSRSGCCH